MSTAISFNLLLTMNSAMTLMASHMSAISFNMLLTMNSVTALMASHMSTAISFTMLLISNLPPTWHPSLLPPTWHPSPLPPTWHPSLLPNASTCPLTMNSGTTLMTSHKQPRACSRRYLQDTPIASAGEPGVLAKMAPMIQRFDLSNTLLASWDAVGEVASELPAMISLRLCKNRLATPFSILTLARLLVLESLCTMDSATNHRLCHALGLRARCSFWNRRLQLPPRFAVLCYWGSQMWWWG
jgi:hypothetical protein